MRWLIIALAWTALAAFFAPLGFIFMFLTLKVYSWPALALIWTGTYLMVRRYYRRREVVR